LAYHIGIDVGSISAKIAIISDKKEDQLLQKLCEQSPFLLGDRPSGLLGGLSFAVSRYRRTLGEPAKVVSELLKELLNHIPKGKIEGSCATGSGGKLISELLNIRFENEFKTVAKGVGVLYPEVRTILEMGGDNSKYLRIEVDEKTRAVGILDYEKNGDCAAGTGSFMDQQASRLLYDIEEVGDVVMKAGRAAIIAGRCSVFAKSDMIHAQQKGYNPPEVLKGLCEAVVRNFKANITKGKAIVPKVAFVGGVAANKGAVEALKAIFDLKEGDLLVPDYYAWMAALGAALLELEAKDNTRLGDLESLRSYSPRGAADFPRTQPLSMDKVILLRDRVKPYSFEGKKGKIEAYLGIDIGSVSTNLALIDGEGNLIKEIYTKTDARPIEVVGKGLKEIERELGDRIIIKGVGTTGSGRELIGKLVGADIIRDEITAHKTGAMYISEKLTRKKVDTIFDIGGQDSKFISIQDGVVVDFTMNEACAAGTGSFLEEQAERLGIDIKGQFSRMALSSRRPIRLGERCTVFMEKDINPYLQMGAKKEDIVAGLAYSIVLNYLNRVVRGRKIGDVIYFQGGTAYNDAVAAAFATILNKEIIVPPHNGVVGAIGMALMAKEKVTRSGKRTSFRGYDLDAVDYTIKTFTCKKCPNYCEIQMLKVEGEKTYWGDKCSDRFRKKVKTEREPVIPDLMKIREELLMRGYESPRGDGIRIGLPRSMYFYDRFPFWCSYFSELGFQIVLSDPTSKKIINYGLDSIVAEPCFPIIVAHGHLKDLINKEVDYIFQPNVINMEPESSEPQSYLCPLGQTLPFVLCNAPAFERYEGKILRPTIRFRDGVGAVKRELRRMAKRLGVSRSRSDRAVDRAYQAQGEFYRNLQQLGEEALSTLASRKEQGIVLLGRPYNINDRAVNLDIPGKLRDYYGVNVIPMDFLPLNNVDISEINNNMFWSYGRKILQAAKFVRQYPNLHIIYISNFKCGPDSYIKHYIREASGKPFLSLQFDAHSNDAGIITRCEAYLDSKGFLK